MMAETVIDIPEEEVEQAQFWPLPYRKNVKSLKKKKNPEVNKKIEDKFADFVESLAQKDIAKVKQDLENDPDLMSYEDDFGVSVIELAVKLRSLELLKLFVENKTCSIRNQIIVIEHALLHAIKENIPCLVEYLLQERSNRCDLLPKREIKALDNDRSHPKKHKKTLKQNFATWSEKRDAAIPAFEDAEFAPFITPIVLASKLGRAKLVQLLLKYDASEIHPLTEPCIYEEGQCEICIERKEFKGRRNLQESQRLLEVYRALSSPAFILSFGVEDPILEAFELCEEMEKMKVEDPSFKNEYDEIGKSCQLFSKQLLEMCRTSDEIRIVLEKSTDLRSALCGVERAIDYNQKEFIAHPYCQQVIQKRWYEGLPNVICNSKWFMLLLIMYMAVWVLLWPFACILFMLKVCPWLIRFMKYPINKFITDTISYLFFLGLLIATNESHCSNGQQRKSDDMFSVVEILLMIWIVGMWTRPMRLFLRHRCRISWRKRIRRWFVCDTTLMLLFFTLWMLIRIGYLIFAKSTGNNKYRNNWMSYHPVLLSEAFFAVGTILAFLKLTGLLKAVSWLGPLQISFRNMLNDIVKFMIIFGIVMFGFVVAISKIYSAYESHVSVYMEDGKVTEIKQGNHYMGFIKTAKTLFFDIFNYGDVQQNAQLIVNSTSQAALQAMAYNSSNITASNDVVTHSFTELLGYFLTGTFYIVIVIVLLNMLIAMMAKSYNEIAANSDREWKFARTKLQMTFFYDVGSLPPPFNVAIIGSAMKCFLKPCLKCSKCCREKYVSGCQQSTYNKSTYENLMTKLNKRFWMWEKTQEKNKITIATDELEEYLKSHTK